MELRHLRYFVAVAEVENISRASLRLHIAQPALSRQIRDLEDELGFPLLLRSARSVQLTPAGRVFLDEARAVLLRADEAVAKSRAVALGTGGELRVGYAPSLAAGILSAAVASFTQIHPGIRVELFDLSTAEMLQGLADASLDVVVSVPQPPKSRASREIRWLPLVRAPWRLAVRRDHRLAGKVRVTPADAVAGPLLIFCRRDYPEYALMLKEWFTEQGLNPRLTREYDGVTSLLAAVESGQGTALIAHRKGRPIPQLLRLKPLDPAPQPICIAAGHRVDRSRDKVLAVFLVELRRAAGRSVTVPG